jgi:hypothetical protein
MQILLESDEKGRTALAQAGNINYSRLLEHLRWLEGKGVVCLVIKEGMVQVRLIESGKEFAKVFSPK